MGDVVPQDRPAMPGQANSARFPRSLRLLRHSDFERVYKQGRRHFGAHLTAFYWVRGDGAGPRVGFTVGKALGGAVQRNRIKRRLREAVRRHGINFRAGVDVVINPKKSVLTLDFDALMAEMHRALESVRKFAESKG